jgi:hypothetical protein
MARITVGLDFGTHQTKICVEDKKDVNNPIYSFFPFCDLNGNKSIILPSIIQVNKDNTLSYGFVDKEKCKYGKKFLLGEMPKLPQKSIIPMNIELPAPLKPSILGQTPPQNKQDVIKWKNHYEREKKSYETQLALWEQRNLALRAKRERQIQDIEIAYNNEMREWYRWQNSSQTNHRLIYRYFKQSTFSDYKWNCKQSSLYLSVWYLSYIIFLLEEKYGKDFAIQMGIPTGSDNFQLKKQKAVSLLLTAYHLVEEVFQCDFDKFLSTTIQDLEELTNFVPYSDDKKLEYSLLVFPEAYAGLKSLTSQRRIESGMSLMVDIGGGTTDITFFTIENKSPKIYDYSSIPFGLNFIAETASPNLQDKFESNLNLYDLNDTSLNQAVDQYSQNLQIACQGLVGKLQKAFERTEFPIHKLKDALKNRIIIYSGGGSTYSQLMKPVLSFSDIKQISPKVWEGLTINEIQPYISMCPIIATSLGLSISEQDDIVNLSSINDLFKHLEGTYQPEEKPIPKWV